MVPARFAGAIFQVCVFAVYAFVPSKRAMSTCTSPLVESVSLRQMSSGSVGKSKRAGSGSVRQVSYSNAGLRTWM